MGQVTGYTFGNASWVEDGTFRIKLTDGTRPGSYVSGRGMHLRHTTPEPVTIPYTEAAGNIQLEVGSDAGPWDWTGYMDGLAQSELTAPDTYGSASVTISWTAGALSGSETGEGSITIQRSSSGSPFSVVAVPVTIEGATCCVGRVGDANGQSGDEPTISDISVMIDAKFISGTCEGKIVCLAEADANQSGGSDPTCDDITISDISTLIDYLFITGPETAVLNDCM